MRPGWKTLLGATLVAPGLWIAIEGRQTSYGDEPGRFGRLFRFGGGASSSAPSSPSPSPAPGAVPSVPSPHDQPPAMLYSAPGAASSNASANRLIPQPRVSRAATESDPILSRISLVRSSDGSQFGMCLQVYADGTVLDNEGTHHLSQADLKPLVDLLQTGELYRQRGHCGAPATDFVEQVHVVVFERSLGRLKANAFSYSGNPQGCDHAVRHLHTVLEALQAKLSRTAPPATAGAAAPAPLSAAPQPLPSGGPSISLSPGN